MARVHFVKKARRDNPACKKGESYFWWKPMVGGRGGSKRYSKSRPRQSQLTNSEFLSQLWSIQEEIADATAESHDDLQSQRDDWVSQLRGLASETEDKLNNMPDGLQQGDTGRMMQERVDAVNSYADDLENVDLDPPESPDAEDAPTVADALGELQSVECGL